MGEAIRDTDAQRGGQPRRPPCARSVGRQGIVYFTLKKEHKATALGPTFETWVHCFNSSFCDINGLQAMRRSLPRRSQSQNVDREIRALWRAPARIPIGQSRAPESDVRDLKCCRSVQFLVPGCCYRFHEDRVFFAGPSVFQPGLFQPGLFRPRRVGPDRERAALSPRAIRSSANLIRSASLTSPFGSRGSLSCFAIRLINAANAGADQILARIRT
jgi:hypothetical protein